MRRLATEKSDIALGVVQHRCDEWWPMFRILLISKPWFRAKCEYTSPICCVPQRGYAARNAIRISLDSYAATYLPDVMCSHKLDYEKMWLTPLQNASRIFLGLFESQ